MLKTCFPLVKSTNYCKDLKILIIYKEGEEIYHVKPQFVETKPCYIIYVKKQATTKITFHQDIVKNFKEK